MKNQGHSRSSLTRQRRTKALAVGAGALLLVILQLFQLSAPSAQAVNALLSPPTPIDPVIGIINAFATHDIVALGEGRHNNEQGHAFRLQLIRDPRFARIVNDIVVESGNARYQALMDRYMQGEDIPRDQLQRVWQDTTVANEVWDVPIYEEFFHAVRDVNATLPARQRLRVLLGDPPIDWNQINSRKDWLAWLAQRDTYPAQVIEQEVLANRRKALVIYGDGHLMRHNVFWNLSDKNLALERFKQSNNSLINLIERRGHRVFSIYTNTYADISAVESTIAQWAPQGLR